MPINWKEEVAYLVCEAIETMAKLWRTDTTSSPLLLLLLSFASVSTDCFCFPAAFWNDEGTKKIMKMLAGFILTDFWVVLFSAGTKIMVVPLLFSPFLYEFVLFLFVFALFPLLFLPPCPRFSSLFYRARELQTSPVFAGLLFKSRMGSWVSIHDVGRRLRFCFCLFNKKIFFLIGGNWDFIGVAI